MIWFGITIENALSERVKLGEGKDATWESKYEMRELLDPAFKMPRPQPPLPKPKPLTGIAAMMALAMQPGSGIKAWQYVKPN